MFVWSKVTILKFVGNFSEASSRLLKNEFVVFYSVHPRDKYRGRLESDPVRLTNWQQFSVDYSLIDHTNDVKMFIILKWFHRKVLNILMAFLWSIIVKTMEIVIDLFFTITFLLKFLGKSRTRERETARRASVIFFTRGLCSHRLFSTNQRARNRSVVWNSHSITLFCLCQNIDGVFLSS